MLLRWRNPPRKKKRLGAGEWQPDLFGGAGIQRADVFAPGLTRAQQLELARQEMREAGARDMFDLLGETPKRNPKPDIPAVENGVHLLRGRDGFATYCERCNEPGPTRATLQAAVADRLMHVHRNPARRVTFRQFVAAWDRGQWNRTRAHRMAERISDPDERRKAERFIQAHEAYGRNPESADTPRRALEAELATLRRQEAALNRPLITLSRKAHKTEAERTELAQLQRRGDELYEQMAALRRRISMANPADTPEIRYQRAVGHGERLATARKAAANPGRAVGRMAPNCPMCGALVRLPNPIPPRVTCRGCGAESLVRRP